MAAGRFTELFDKIQDVNIWGGCDQCNAYQKVVKIEDGIWNMTVFHDDWCPIHGAEEAP